MTPRKMHENELHTDEGLVTRLLAAQFPEWMELPLARVPSIGTDNALYRLGDDMVVRLPRIDWAVGAVAKDVEWLPKLAPLLPVEIPVPLAKGEPAEGYPWEWGIYRWLEGDDLTTQDGVDIDSLTTDLIAFVRALHDADVAGGPAVHRGGPLTGQDEGARAALEEMRGEIDVAKATRLWDAALAIPAWSGPPVWIHGDLLAGNLLMRDGRLTGVIDWGVAGVGDPASDMLAAWGALPSEARDRFRTELEVDHATWERGKGWALSVGLVAFPYYRVTNPGLAKIARHLIDEVLREAT